MTDRPDDHEALELLPPYLLGALASEEQARVERALERSAEISEALEQLRGLGARWGAERSAHPTESELAGLLAGGIDTGRRRAVTRHLLDCEDCRFEAAVLAAGEKQASRQSARRAWSRWAAGAVAASLVLGVVGFQMVARLARPGEGAASFRPVAVDAVRGDREIPVVYRSAADDDGVRLRVETRLNRKTIPWKIVVSTDQRVVIQGTRRVDSSSTAPTSVEFLVPWDALAPSTYELVIVLGDGTEKRWHFAVRD